jgi:hypothetical protein
MAAVAQSQIQDDVPVHPLLRHPRPIKRDSAKAQRMLGLIADSEEKLKGVQRERSITTKWLERPMYEHLEASDVESEKEEVVGAQVEEKTYENELAKIISNRKISPVKVADDDKLDNDEDLLDKWTNPERPTSINLDVKQGLVEPKTKLDASFIRRRPGPLKLSRPVSYHAQHLLSPEWTASPATMSPHTRGPRPASSYLSSPSLPKSSLSSPDSVCECNPPIAHPQTWPTPPMQQSSNVRAVRPTSFHPGSSASFGSPPKQRPRPTSFATYHQRNRSGTKIASSRGLRNNSYPNYSRPMSGIAPKPVPGEHMENDMIYNRFADDEVGPPSPTSPIQEASPDRDVFAAFETRDKELTEKRLKKRWSTIPQLVKRVAARRKSSAASQEPPTFEVQEVQTDDLRRVNLAEETLHWYEKEERQASSRPRSRLSVADLIPTPTYSPFDATYLQGECELTTKTDPKLGPLPLPFAPWADAPPSPADSTDNRQQSSGVSSLSPTRKARSSRLSFEAVPQVRPTSAYSQRSSIVLVSPLITAHPTFEVSASSRTSRRGTPIPDPTCIMCKTSKPPCEFRERRITANCWHDSATCAQCLQAWVYQSVQRQGWDRCTCPECGEVMAHEDITAFAEGLGYTC